MGYWSSTALDAHTKLIVFWMVGGRDGQSAYEFMKDLAVRLANRVQLTTDVVLQFLRESICEACEPSHVHPHGEVLALNDITLKHNINMNRLDPTKRSRVIALS
jgi:hypothetical protein